MKARTLKKKSFHKTGQEKLVTFSKQQKCAVFFFSLSSSLQAEEKQPGWTAQREKKKEHCAPITMLPQILTKSNRLQQPQKKGFVSKILAQQALANLSTALLCQETSSKERPRLTGETNVGYDTSCVCTCVCQGGERQMSQYSGYKP